MILSKAKIAQTHLCCAIVDIHPHIRVPPPSFNRCCSPIGVYPLPFGLIVLIRIKSRRLAIREICSGKKIVPWLVVRIATSSTSAEEEGIEDLHQLLVPQSGSDYFSSFISSNNWTERRRQVKNEYIYLVRELGRGEQSKAVGFLSAHVREVLVDYDHRSIGCARYDQDGMIF